MFDQRRGGEGARRHCRAGPEDFPRPRSPLTERRTDAEFIASANKLLSNALPLLMLVPKLRKIAFHQSVGDLQER